VLRPAAAPSDPTSESRSWGEEPSSIATRAPAPGSEMPDGVSLAKVLDDYERRLIQRAIETARGNIAEAARRLQTDRPNLYRRMKRLGLGAQSTEASGAGDQE
jgi:DNA-binding NtrC family response regulator